MAVRIGTVYEDGSVELDGPKLSTAQVAFLIAFLRSHAYANAHLATTRRPHRAQTAAQRAAALHNLEKARATRHAHAHGRKPPKTHRRKGVRHHRAKRPAHSTAIRSVVVPIRL